MPTNAAPTPTAAGPAGEPDSRRIATHVVTRGSHTGDHGQRRLRRRPAADAHRHGEQRRQQRIVGRDLPIRSRRGPSSAGRGRPRGTAVPPLGDLVADVEVDVLADAGRRQQVLRFVSRHTGAVRRPGVDADQRGQRRQHADDDRRGHAPRPSVVHHERVEAGALGSPTSPRPSRRGPRHPTAPSAMSMT